VRIWKRSEPSPESGWIEARGRSRVHGVLRICRRFSRLPNPSRTARAPSFKAAGSLVAVQRSSRRKPRLFARSLKFVRPFRPCLCFADGPSLFQESPVQGFDFLRKRTDQARGLTAPGRLISNLLSRSHSRSNSERKSLRISSSVTRGGP